MRRRFRILLVLAALMLCATPAGAMRTHGSIQNQRYDGYEIRQGVDVSEHNGKIDWNAVAASGQADFAFIRVGYRGYSSGGLYPDSRYRENLNGALAAGLEVGAYIYSQATTEAEARAEADYALELLKDYLDDLTLPVVLDVEYAESNGYTGRLYEAKLSGPALTKICNAFCDVIYRAGLTPAIYANSVMLTDKLYADAIDGAVWLANYVDETAYPGEYTYWQYTSNGGVYGFEGAVDRNYWYVSPPSRHAVRAETLRLEDRDLRLSVGDTIQLTAKITPRDCVDTLRFFSEDPTVAYVDKLSGEVTAFRAGETTLWVQTGNGLYDRCAVSVTGDRTDALSLTIIDAPDTIYTGADTRTNLVVSSSDMAGATARVSVDLLNLRAMPSTDFAPIATLEKGEQVSILDSVTNDEATWLAIRRELDGATGFVASGYLSDFSNVSPLVEGQDYLATYAGNNRPGEATVTVEALGRYEGSVSASFTIFSFDDVKPGEWYYSTILHAVQKGIMKGTSDTAFSPDQATNRAMMATVLYRMDGSPAADTVPFSDVKSDDWFASAVNWAVSTGVDTGVSALRYDPTGMLTRAHMVTMLYRYTNYLGYATPVDRSLGESFSDWSAVPESARDAVCWAVGCGLMQGVGQNTLSPASGATRAQMCTVLARHEDLLATLQFSGSSSDGDAPLLAGD